MNLKISILTILISVCGFSQNQIDQWTKEFHQTKKNEIKKEVYLKINNYYSTTNKNNDSLNKYVSIHVPIEGDSLFYAEKAYHTAILNSALSKYSTCIENATIAARLFKKYDKPYQNALATRLLGNVHQILFKNQKALLYFDKANTILKGKDRVQMLIGYGAVHGQLNNLDTAIKYYLEAYNTSVEYNFDIHLFNVYNGLANTQYKSRNYDQAILYFQKAIKIASNQKNILKEAIGLQNLGNLYNASKRFKESKPLFEQTISLFDQFDHEFLKASTYHKYANCLSNLNQIPEAIIFASKAENIYSKMGNKGRLSDVLKTKAAIEYKQQNYNNSIKLLKEVIHLSNDTEIKSVTGVAYYDLAKVYKEIGDAKKSFDAFENSVNINDSLSNIKNTLAIEKMKAEFEASELENKLKQDVIILSEKNISSNYRNLLLAFAILGLLFFIYRQRNINSTKQRTLTQEKEIISLNEALLKEKVKHGKSQITEYAIQIDERNRFLSNIKGQINDIRDLSEDVNQKRKINDLQYFISDSISVNQGKVALDKNEDNPEEQLRFDLIQKYPKLTEKEITVCRLLVLNLASKQIAQKMGITVQSVNNYRASIRKKVELEAGGNLKRFLKQV